MGRFDVVQPKSFSDMLSISYMGFKSSTKGKTFEDCLSHIDLDGIMENGRIIEEKYNTPKTLGFMSLLYFSMGIVYK